MAGPYWKSPTRKEEQVTCKNLVVEGTLTLDGNELSPADLATTGHTGSTLGFFSTTPVSQQTSAANADVVATADVVPQNADGGIAALTFSSTPTQAEAEALRDACEDLAEDVLLLAAKQTADIDALIAKVNAINDALVAYGLMADA